MLIQGPMGLYLHIFQKLKLSRSFFLLSSVDGGIQWLNEQDFYSQLKITPSRDPLDTAWAIMMQTVPFGYNHTVETIFIYS